MNLGTVNKSTVQLDKTWRPPGMSVYKETSQIFSMQLLLLSLFRQLISDIQGNLDLSIGPGEVHAPAEATFVATVNCIFLSFFLNLLLRLLFTQKGLS